MKKNNTTKIWIIFLILVVAIVAVIYFLSKSQAVKDYSDSLHERINNLKRQICEKEQTVEWLERELTKLREIKDYLTKKGERIFIRLKTISILFLLGFGLSLYLFYNCHFITGVLTTVAFIAFLIQSVHIILRNEIVNWNEFLNLLQNLCTKQVMKWHEFEPEIIQIYETRLNTERTELQDLRMKLNRLIEK